MNIYKNKLVFIFISILILILTFYFGYNLGKNNIKDIAEDKNNTVSTENQINLGLEDNSVENIVIDTSISENLIYQLLVDTIAESDVKGIDDLYLNISSQGIDLSAKYTLLGFIKIPAQFTLIPELQEKNIKLSISNVKIMNLKVNVDKIIEKWINLNEDMKEMLTYDSGSIIVDGSLINIAEIKEISLDNNLLNLKLSINKDKLK